MGEGQVRYINEHPNYKPQRVNAFQYFQMDKRLNDTAQAVYRFLLSKVQGREDKLYVSCGSVGELRDMYQRHRVESGLKLLAETEVAAGVTLLRKFRYIKFTYDDDLSQKIILLEKKIGDLV